MPGQPRALNGLAWILATSPDEGVRRPDEATRLARHAAELTQRRDPAVLDTLAAALAATGQFDRAKKTAQAALDLANSAGNLEIAQQIELRLEGYQQERPHVDRKSES